MASKKTVDVSIEEGLVNKIFQGDLGCTFHMPMTRKFRDEYGQKHHESADLHVTFRETDDPDVIEAVFEVVARAYWQVDDDDDWAADCGLTD